MIFFALLPVEWNESAGLLRHREWHTITRIALYISDEVPAVLFFSIYAAVSLFWADLYLCAIEHIRFYQTVVRPLTLVANLVSDREDDVGVDGGVSDWVHHLVSVVGGVVREC